MESRQEKRTDRRKTVRLVWALAKNDFRSKYATSQLGIFWAFFRPVVMACVYILVFSLLTRSTPVGEGVPYALWLLPGLIVWFVFSESMSTGTNALVEYSFLVKNIRFEVALLPIVKVVSAFFIHTFFLALVALLYLLFGLPFHWTMLQLPYYYLATFCFTLTLVRIVSAVQPFFRDMSVAVEILLLVGIWACPIMWNLTMIPERFRWVFQLNPLYHLVQGYRDSFLGTAWLWEDLPHLALFWGVTVLLAVFGRMFFRRVSPHFADVM